MCEIKIHKTRHITITSLIRRIVQSYWFIRLLANSKYPVNRPAILNVHKTGSNNGSGSSRESTSVRLYLQFRTRCSQVRWSDSQITHSQRRKVSHLLDGYTETDSIHNITEHSTPRYRCVDWHAMGLKLIDLMIMVTIVLHYTIHLVKQILLLFLLLIMITTILNTKSKVTLL
jgi:hypothetical protein